MSAPHTDIDKQEKRHKGPLAGMGLVVAFALVLLAALTIWLSFSGNEPENADVKIDGRDGDAVVVDEPAPSDPDSTTNTRPAPSVDADATTAPPVTE